MILLTHLHTYILSRSARATQIIVVLLTIFQPSLVITIPFFRLIILTFNLNTSPSDSISSNRKDSQSSLKILQWNCQGMRSKLASLQFASRHYDLICLQESLLYNSNKLLLKGFQVIRKDITGPGLRGICTCVRSNIPYSIADLSDFTHPSLELLGIIIEVNESPCLILNIYRHPNLSTSYMVFDGLLNRLKCFSQVLLIGDFNAHHIHWFNTHEDSSGRSLARAIDKYNFVILNENHPTLVLPPESRESIIDLSIASPNLASLCLSSTMDDSWGSDHYPLSTIINGLVKSRNRFIYKWPLLSHHLDALSFLCSTRPISFDSLPGNSGAEKYEGFVTHIRSIVSGLISAKYCSPRSTPAKSCRSSPPWWNDACQQAIDSRKEASVIFRKFPTRENYNRCYVQEGLLEGSEKAEK